MLLLCAAVHQAQYALYLEDPKVFLLAARKRKKPTSNYLVSRDHDDLDRSAQGGRSQGTRAVHT